MKNNNRATSAALAALVVIIHGPVCAQTRTQSVSLEKGWNAVWLEVRPEFTSPGDVFAGAQVDIVAGYAPPASEAQFAKNSAVNMQSLNGWSVWYAPHRADAPLSRLHSLGADMGYLVHALEPAVVEVRGTVTGAGLKWTPNRFNLAGFTVAEQGGPTFRQLLAGSAAHNHNKVYRLAAGVWRQVLDTDAEAPRPGEAFWVFCAGGSEYQGPLSVKANGGIGLMLAGALPGELVLKNESPHPLTVVMEMSGDDGNAVVPLALNVRALLPDGGGVADVPVDFPEGAWSQEFPPLEAGAGLSLPLVARVGEAAGEATGLLKVATDIGTVSWVPVRTVK